jgi:hypothetical protein
LVNDEPRFKNQRRCVSRRGHGAARRGGGRSNRDRAYNNSGSHSCSNGGGELSPSLN